jgi:hypothetical protein
MALCCPTRRALLQQLLQLLQLLVVTLDSLLLYVQASCCC